jgi:hypothetical protein
MLDLDMLGADDSLVLVGEYDIDDEKKEPEQKK